MLCRKASRQRQKDRHSEIHAASFTEGFSTTATTATTTSATYSSDTPSIVEEHTPLSSRHVADSDESKMHAQTCIGGSKKIAVLSVLCEQADDDSAEVDCASHVMRLARTAAASAKSPIVASHQTNRFNSIAQALSFSARSDAARDSLFTWTRASGCSVIMPELTDSGSSEGDCEAVQEEEEQGWGWTTGCGFDYGIQSDALA
jgi:hypothetical protein